MKMQFVLGLVVLLLAACHAREGEKSSELNYSPFNENLTHTTYLGPAPSVRPANQLNKP